MGLRRRAVPTGDPQRDHGGDLALSAFQSEGDGVIADTTDYVIGDDRIDASVEEVSAMDRDRPRIAEKKKLRVGREMSISVPIPWR
ncbi:MAG: hypothetical protein AAF366_04030 [Pseudomonadota bacterium]